tara:strand:- start:31 stop:732 length:702 start_codon:yes stop_codon:yes gene_type:complete
MPRLPVDGKKVIEYRVTLGTYERERLSEFVGSYSFSRVSRPIVDVLGSPVALLSITGGIIALNPKILQGLPDWLKAIIFDDNLTFGEREKTLSDYFTGGALVGGLAGLFFLGPISPLVGTLLGAALGEGFEDKIEEYVTQEIMEDGGQALLSGNPYFTGLDVLRDLVFGGGETPQVQAGDNTATWSSEGPSKNSESEQGLTGLDLLPSESVSLLGFLVLSLNLSAKKMIEMGA